MTFTNEEGTDTLKLVITVYLERLRRRRRRIVFKLLVSFESQPQIYRAKLPREFYKWSRTEIMSSLIKSLWQVILLFLVYIFRCILEDKIRNYGNFSDKFEVGIIYTLNFRPVNDL